MATLKEKKVEKKVAVSKKSTTVSSKKNILNDVLVKPLISEKANIFEMAGVYTFEISRKATKVDVANTIAHLYGVRPTKVRVMNYEGKIIRRGKWSGRRKDWKKAVVTLPKGKTIDIHTGV